MKQTQQNKTEWKEVELGEILDYEQPQNYIVESIDYDDEYKIPVLTAGKSFILGYTDETKGIFNKLPAIIFDDFTTDIKFVDFKFKVKSSAMKILRPKTNNINLKFVFLMMKKINHNFSQHKRYYLSVYQRIKIPIPFSNNKPDLKEQERIVSILEKAEKLKQKREEADNKTKDYLQSVFYEIFGNPVKNDKKWNQDYLENVCDKITDGEHATPELTIKGIPYISAKNINEVIDFNDVKYIDDETYKKITKRCLPEYGDILITCVGTIGRVKRIDIKDKFVFARSVALIKPKKLGISNIFLEKMLSLPSMKKYMIGNTNEATVKGLYLKQINKLRVIVPPLFLQQKFANIVEKVEKLKEKQKKSKEKIDEMFNALMQKAFKGEL